MISAKQRAALERGRRISHTKSRPRKESTAAHPFGILADRIYRPFGAGMKRGVIHFSV